MKNLLEGVTVSKEIKESFESPHVSMWLDGDIMCARYVKNLKMTLDVAKSCVGARLFFAKGKSYPLLVDMTGIKSVTADARKYMATVGVTWVTAGALITGSSLSKTIGNIFLAIDKPAVPTRLFTDEEKARQWLEQF
jgi:hypothetical protein